MRRRATNSSGPRRGRVDGLREVSGSHAVGNGGEWGGEWGWGRRTGCTSWASDRRRSCAARTWPDCRGCWRSGASHRDQPGRPAQCEPRGRAGLQLAVLQHPVGGGTHGRRGDRAAARPAHQVVADAPWAVGQVGIGLARSAGTLGIVGYGRIGSQVSILAEERSGMRVVYFDVAPVLPLGNARVPHARGAAVAVRRRVAARAGDQSDQNLVSSRLIGLMKPGALLISNARECRGPGRSPRQLKSGKVGGAALDVFPDEPSSNDEVFRFPSAGSTTSFSRPTSRAARSRPSRRSRRT